LVLLLGSLTALAQNNASIKGVVRDASGPLPFTNVFITLQSDTTKIITGAVTDSLGNFQLNELSANSYILKAQTIGFTPHRAVVQLPSSSSKIDLGEIILQSDTKMLDAIEVTAMRNLIQKTDEGFTVKASDNITQIGGTAADLLKNMPGVLVGADGDVTIRGKTPLTLINGRISGIAGIDRAAQLERIPASSIERIEIINNPSAKYDADSEGGIINIILKKNEDKGTNGAFAIGAGYGQRYRLNGSALLNHRTKKWNLGAAYDNWYTTRTRKVQGDRVNYYLPAEYYLTQRRFDERLIFYQNAKANVDFTPTKNDRINLEALWAFPGENNNETLKNTVEGQQNDFNYRNQRYSNEIRRTHTLEMSLNYAKRFNDPAKSLNVNVSNTLSNDKENTDIETQYLSEGDEPIGEVARQRTHVYQKTNLANAALDYVQPIADRLNLESGYKGIARFLNSDYQRASESNGDYVIDPANSNVFRFHEQIHAVYSQINGWTGSKDDPKWKYAAGLRAEKVWNKGQTLDDNQEFTNEYFNLFPSANVTYFTPSQNNIKASYSRRIVRPGLGQLNPFTDITDSLNQSTGNPRLKPELIHSMELGYTQTLQKASLTLTAFYRIRKRAIMPYTIINDDGVGLTQPRNFGAATTLGLEILGSYNFANWWSMNLSFSAYKIHIDDLADATGASNDLISWYTKLINNFTISKNGKLQVIGNYTSPTATPQGQSLAVYFVDIGFQQKIMKGRGRMGAVITDLFNTQRSGSSISDDNFSSRRTVKLDTRAIMVTFGYTFGTSFKEKLMENRFQN